MSEQIISKRCSKCKQIKSLSKFYKQARGKYGRRSDCKVCQKTYRRKYSQTERGKYLKKKNDAHYSQTGKGKIARRKANYRYHQTEKGKLVSVGIHKRYRLKHPKHIKDYEEQYIAKYPERIKARSAVQCAIKAGKLPRPNTLQCSYGKHKAEQYHHYKDYAKKHWLDVVPACRKCHYEIHKKSA